jgi:hypothetical protein
MSKKLSGAAPLYKGDFQMDHRSASAHRFSKANDDTSRHGGKFASSIHSHSDCINSVPPSAITPSKEDRRLARLRSSTKRAISSKGSRRTQRDDVIDSKKSATSVSDPPLSCIAINWLSPTEVRVELEKHLSNDESVPTSTEDQLEFLMNKFPLPELKSAYYLTMGKLGADVKSVNLPTYARTDVVKEAFIAMIYDHRSMMYDRINSRGPEHR